MSIPAWRNIEYTDDGCSIFQCLNCYKTWEARTNPEWGEWKFCPVCGIAWEKEIKNPHDLTFERRGLKFKSKLERAAEVSLEIKHYGENLWGSLEDWGFISYGMRFMGLPNSNDERYKDLPEVYKDYMYRVNIANLIKDLAQNYSNSNKLCDNFFMFSEGFELRVKVVSRITGKTSYIMLTKGILPVIHKTP
jgi:hypothetical protein